MVVVVVEAEAAAEVGPVLQPLVLVLVLVLVLGDEQVEAAEVVEVVEANMKWH